VNVGLVLLAAWLQLGVVVALLVRRVARRLPPVPPSTRSITSASREVSSDGGSGSERT
jgi:hypothetical protein